MTVEWTTVEPAKDRRVRRSRAALMRAAIDLVGARESANVPVSDIAAAADVSRQVLYLQFGDRDTLLLEAALDLVRRELLEPLTRRPGGGRASTLALATHFAAHRRFYRAMLTSSSAFALNKALTSLFVPINRRYASRVRTGEQAVDDLAAFITGGAAALVNTWVVEGADPLDPEEFTDRLMRIHPALEERP
ncbi:TetR/AcrR family transcriptional regulator [Amycolatopsis sp. cmx-4-83]|uniref:TetR/AcrR family transcriptional regulator n=1 Tax=Amycolatopsis sp. cmx-4-83 TaxID=2790940 RepID=UPI00397B6663